MNWLIILIFFLFKIKKDTNEYISKVYFFENDFWNNDENSAKTDKGFLFGFSIVEKDYHAFGLCVDYLSIDCFYLRATNQRYAILQEWIVDEFLVDPNTAITENKILRIHFLYTDTPIKDYNQLLFNYQGEKKYYETYRWFEKSSNNIIKLKFDEDEARLISIKEKLGRFIRLHLNKFHEYISTFGSENILRSLEKEYNFDLFYFNSYSNCLKNLKKFVVSFQYLKLLEDEDSKVSIDINTNMKVNEFMKRIITTIDEDFKKIEDNFVGGRLKTSFEVFYNCFYKTKDLFNKKFAVIDFKSLIKKCLNNLKDDILNNHIILPIGGNYDIVFYINELCVRAYESISTNQKGYSVDKPEVNDYVFSIIKKSFYNSIRELQESIMKDISKFEHVQQHFSELLGKKLETCDDNVIVEKIICDYHSMLVYVSNFGFSFDKSLLSTYYYPPIYIDNYNCRIISGIEINLIAWINDLEVIEALDNKGQKVAFEKDVHYFINDVYKLYCTSNVLKEINIKTINLKSKYGNIKRFEVG